MRSVIVKLILAIAGICLTAIAVHAQDSPHGKLSVACDQCHDTDSWKVLPSGVRFQHSRTGFPLEGQHGQVACRQCHATLKFSEAEDRCGSCHTDVHRNELGANCERCHSPESWLVPDMPQRHVSTRFALLGAHRRAQCQACHTNEQKHTYAGAPIECYSCHRNDYDATVAPAHRASGISTNCESCHSVSAATWGGKFDHATTGFPLNGSHAAVSCLQCHKNNVFNGLPADCYSCHTSDFTRTTKPPHQASGFGTDCVTCHGTGAANWAGSFNHSQTGFALNGRHVGVACTQCHVNNVYKGLPSTCVSCHQQDYNSSTNPNHTTSGFPTTCETCHSTSGWTPSTFDHEPSFPISSTAVHRPGRWTSCADCHTSASDIRVFSCIGCHEHAQSAMDSKHRGNSRYSYSSAACYNCHPRGRE